MTMDSFAKNKCMIFRLNDNGEGPELIRNVFLERGWLEFRDDKDSDYEWNLWWKTTRFRTSDHDNLMPWQRLNHYPKSTAITKKDSLARNMKRMAAVYGSDVYNFSPLSYILPNDYTRFVGDFTNWQNKNPNKPQYWICKPADLSRGRGIFLFKELSELMYDYNAVIQSYCINPFLISGYKFDLRIYVCVTSFYPLRIYICQEGLARFSTEKFDLGSIDNIFSHLTNTSINKYSPSYSSDKERVGAGCKWTLTQLRHYLHQVHVDDGELWSRVIRIIVLTLLVQVPQVPAINNCFELYGFDILVDKDLKPWLLEVNFSPSFAYDCKADADVKKSLVHDLLDVLNFKETDCDRGGDEYRRSRASIAQMSRGSSLPRKPLGRTHSTGRLRTPRKPSICNKLPRINLSESVSSSYSSSSCIDEGDGEDDRPPTPLTPGCGLPSVQQSSRSSHRTSSLSSGSMSSLSMRSSYGESLTARSCPSRLPDYHRENSREDTFGYSKNELSVPSARPFSRKRQTQKNDRQPLTQSMLSSNRKVSDLAPKSSGIVPVKRSASESRKTYTLPKKNSARPRPWRQQSKTSHTPSGTTPDISGPKKQVGSFFLAFPFNDTTSKLTKSATFDVRTAIKETQKQWKQRLAKLKKDPSLTSCLLWPPLKATGS